MVVSYPVIMDDQQSISAGNPVRVPSKALKAACAVMSPAARELDVSFSDDGWVMSAIDPTKAMICNVTISARPLPEPFSVPFESMLRAIRGDTLTIAQEAGLVIVRAGNVSTRIRTLVPDAPFRLPREFEYTAHASVLSDDLRDILSSADPSRVGTAKLVIDRDGLTVNVLDSSGEGQMLTVPPEECISLEGEAAAGYNVRMLAALLKAVPRGSEILIEMGEDYPMRLTVEGEGWSAWCVLAPLIEEEGA